MAVVDGDGEGLGDGLACCQVIDRVVGHRVGPADDACAVGGGGVRDRGGQSAQHRAAHRAGGGGGDGNRLDVDQVDIGDREGTRVAEICSGLAGGAVGDLGDSSGDISSGDDRSVIAAGDRDGYDLIDVAAFLIGDADREEVRDGFSRRQVLNHRAGVGQRIGPLAAVALEGERAVVADAAGSAALDAPGGGGAGIDVAGAERACGADGAVFCDGAGGIACGEGNDRLVIGAGDRDGDAACNRAAVTINDIEGEGFNLGLILGQVLNDAGGNAVVPGDHAA